MEQKNIWIIGGIVGACIVGFIVWGSADVSMDPSADDIVYYFGDTCPHCIEVKKVIGEKRLHDSVVFSEKEVWKNAKNSSEMMRKAKECDVPKEKVGVPFLWSKGKCFIGAPDVLGELEAQANIEKEDNS